MKKRALSVLAACILLFSACSAGGQEPPPDPGVTTLIYAKISENGVDQKRLSAFNLEHKGEVQIEVRDYTQLSEGGKQGVDLLMTEIAAGKGPDIIELGAAGETSLLPYRQLAEKGYLEDLWPYIEAAPGLVMEAPLKAAEVNGGLFAIFEFVRLHTLIGAKAVVGDRTNWTVKELLESFSSMPEGTVILDNHWDWENPSVKNHLLSSFLYGFSDLFVNWENGQCFFDSEKFRSFLELANQMSDEYEYRKKCTNRAEALRMHVSRLRDGSVMLEDIGFEQMSNIQEFDLYFNGAACVGYPVDDGSSGSYFRPVGIKLAMSSTCRDKEAAWQYMRQMFYLPKSLHDYVYQAIPVSRSAYERVIKEVMEWEHASAHSGEILHFDVLTAEDLRRAESLFNSTTRSSILADKKLVDIVTEVAGAYFAGDRTLDETIAQIENRVGLYVNEQK